MTYNDLFLCCVVLLTAGQIHAQLNSDACRTGPPPDSQASIFEIGRVFLEGESGVHCNGVITMWHFCHYVIGFRHLDVELWPSVWRKDGDVFNLVGLNRIHLAAHDNHSESLQCLNYTTRPEEWVETQKGDFIGFFSPENGVFISHSHDVSNRGIQQMQRIERGFVETFNASELQVVGSHRGVINAYIDSGRIIPSRVPSLKSTTILASSKSTIILASSTPATPVLETRGESKSSPPSSFITLAIVAASAIVILSLLVVIVILIIKLRQKHSTYPQSKPAIAVDATNPAIADVTYDTIPSQTKGYANGSSKNGAPDVGYSMIDNPSYIDAISNNSHTYSTIGESLSVANPTYHIPTGAKQAPVVASEVNSSKFASYSTPKSATPAAKFPHQATIENGSGNPYQIPRPSNHHT